jgi:nucleotide-binding universal stress UspA family protein
MYTDILIPTDGSELAGKAVQHGIALAKTPIRPRGTRKKRSS